MIGIERELIIILSLFSLLLIISVTDYLYMLIPDCILISFAVLLILESVFVQLVTWTDSIVGSGVIFLFVILHAKDISRRAWRRRYKTTFVTWFYSRSEGSFIVLFFSILF